MKKSSKKKTDSKRDYSMKDTCRMDSSGCGSCFYFLGFLGAATYYIQTSTGFWNGVLGVLKAIIWPLFLVYKLLGLN